jgi:hypothetical protein
MNTAWLATQPAVAVGQGLARGARVAEYQIIEPLREGSAHTLYRAHDRVRDEQVLLKEYLPAHIAWRTARGGVGTALRDAGEFARGRGAFLQRGLLTARFAHAALMPVSRVLEHGGTGYWVRPWQPGQPLAEASAARQPGPDHAWTLQLLCPLLDLLARLHAAGVTGVDLSASNVLVVQASQVQLLAVRCAAPALGLAAGVAAAAERDLRALALLVRTQLAHRGAGHRFPVPFVESLDAMIEDRQPSAMRSVAAFADALGIGPANPAPRRTGSPRSPLRRAPMRLYDGQRAFAPTQPFEPLEPLRPGFATTLPMALPEPPQPASPARPSPALPARPELTAVPAAPTALRAAVRMPRLEPRPDPVIVALQPSQPVVMRPLQCRVIPRRHRPWRSAARWLLAAAGVTLLTLGLRR